MMYNSFMMNIKMITTALYIIIGNLLVAFAVATFLLPQDILTGGVAGIAVLVQDFIPFDKGIIVLIINTGFFFIGLVFLGKEFALKTIASTILYPLFLNILLSTGYTADVDRILASVFGGLIAGIGIALVIRKDGSTGGVDIPTLIIHKYTHIEVNHLLMIIDGLTVMFGLFIFGLNDVLIGLVSVFTTSAGVKFIINYQGQKAMEIKIISSKYKEINDIIINTVDRGSTIFDVVGGYTNKPRKLITVVVDNKEYFKLKDIIHEIDSHAFVIASETTDVFGRGFSAMTRV